MTDIDPRPAVHRLRDFDLLVAERKLMRRGAEQALVPLGGRAFDVLLALVERGGGLVTKDELLQCAWPGLVVEESNVHVQVSHLRKLLGADAIATVAGLGYRFAWPLAGGAGTSGPARVALPALPAERTPFIGREAVLAEAERALAGARLLTLVGIGGTGKTRLALRLAMRCQDVREGGVAWVDLAPVGDAEGLVSAVAQACACTTALGAPPSSSAVQTLGAHLRDRRLLLVLDNCEHLLDAAGDLVDTLLAAAPGLAVLATSREALGLPGETALPVRPLDVPPDGTGAVEAAGSEAVRLFAQAAALVAPRLSLSDPAQAGVVAEICRRVDGIPLALELAAAQLKVLSPTQLLELLRERFRLLVGPRRALARQQTLQAVIQWSHDHLTADEQALLGALSVCRGGCDLEAVSAIAAQPSRPTLLSALARLVELSLVKVSHGDSADPPVARYDLLETVRHFALEHLQARGGTEDACDRHAAHFLTMAEAHDEAVRRGDADVPVLLRRLTREHENLMQAVAWLEQGDPADGRLGRGVRLVGALRHYWSARGLLHLGLSVTQSIARRLAPDMQVPPGASAAQVLWLLCGLVQLVRFAGDTAAAASWSSRTIAAATVQGDAALIAVAHGLAGSIAIDQGRLDEAEAHATASLRAATEADMPPRTVDAHSLLARVAAARGDLADARRRIAQVIALRQVQGHPFKLAADHLTAAELALECDDRGAAVSHLREVQALLPAVASLGMDLATVGLCAWLLSSSGKHDRAAVLHSLMRVQQHELRFSTPPKGDARCHQQLEAARRALGADAFEAACAAGAALSPAVALRQATVWLQELRVAEPRMAADGPI